MAIGMSVLTSCSTIPSDPAVPGYVDTAEVIQVEPLYQAVQVARPVNECWTERVARRNPGQGVYAGPVVGGILGGVLGNQLIRGRGRPPAMASVRRCRTVKRYEPRQQLIGYRVDYRYEGQTFTTRTRGNPGRFIRVRVDVDPVDGT
jgi:uncharacterized protein YcfJ